MSGHVVSPKIYVLVFLTLIAFTALTTAVAFVDLGAFNTVIALAIAVCKMLLVILFFMHVRYSPNLTKIVIAAAFFWLLILISLTMGDYHTRDWTPSPPGWSSQQSQGTPAGSSAPPSQAPPSSTAP
jgi:cytochrome c oxidase subunit 4